MLGDAEGLLFTEEMIENHRVGAPGKPDAPRALPLRFIAVDPSVAENPRDECGIVAIGSTIERDLSQRHAYILEDYSVHGNPQYWAEAVVEAARLQRTKFIVAERNQGGALIQMAINAIDPTLKVFTVVATKGKQLRAEPVVMTMQQGRVHFVDILPVLEEQLIYFDPEDKTTSPDRMDAMVWGVTAALISPPDGLRFSRTRATSFAGRQLPQGLGTGRIRQATRAPRTAMRAG
jgi:phage terminase large subunit-like protein